MREARCVVLLAGMACGVVLAQGAQEGVQHPDTLRMLVPWKSFDFFGFFLDRGRIGCILL